VGLSGRADAAAAAVFRRRRAARHGRAPAGPAAGRQPARRFGLYPRKGALLPGADADFTVVDPGARWTFSAAEAFSVAKWSPYDGMELQGRVDLTVVRGEPVFENGAIVREAGHGRFVAPQTPGVSVDDERGGVGGGRAGSRRR